MYARSTHLLELADYSDFGRSRTYGSQITYSDIVEGTIPAGRVQAPIAPGAAASVDLANYTTIRELLVWAEPTTGLNYVTATFRSAGGAAVDQYQRIASGATLILVDVTAGAGRTITFLANGIAAYVTYAILAL